MLERIVAQITMALLGWLDRRIEAGNRAVDADPDRVTLRRGGTRIREWLRKQDDLRSRSKPNAGGSVGRDAGLPPNQR